MIKLSELEENAKAATQGDWSADPRGGGCVLGGPLVQYESRSSQTQVALATLNGRRSSEERDANVRHIAAANPETVLKLIAALRDCVEAMQESKARSEDVADSWCHLPLRDALARIRQEVDFE